MGRPCPAARQCAERGAPFHRPRTWLALPWPTGRYAPERGAPFDSPCTWLARPASVVAPWSAPRQHKPLHREPLPIKENALAQGLIGGGVPARYDVVRGRAGVDLL